MNAEERLLNAGYDDIIYLTNYSYDDALIGVSDDGRAIYDYDKMVEWLMKEESFISTEAMEWIDYNTIRALPYMGDRAPIIMYPIE
jgi:cytochrome c2